MFTAFKKCIRRFRASFFNIDNIRFQFKSDNLVLSDSEILKTYYKFSNRIQTNTFCAAEMEWAKISTICYYRPQLTRELIRLGLLTIIYSIGDEITAEDVLGFVRVGVIENPSPYGGKPDEAGLFWLKEVLPNQKVLIQEVLVEVIEQNRRDLENI